MSRNPSAAPTGPEVAPPTAAAASGNDWDPFAPATMTRASSSDDPFLSLARRSSGSGPSVSSAASAATAATAATASAATANASSSFLVRKNAQQQQATATAGPRQLSVNVESGQRNSTISVNNFPASPLHAVPPNQTPDLGNSWSQWPVLAVVSSTPAASAAASGPPSAAATAGSNGSTKPAAVKTEDPFGASPAPQGKTPSALRPDSSNFIGSPRKSILSDFPPLASAASASSSSAASVGTSTTSTTTNTNNSNTNTSTPPPKTAPTVSTTVVPTGGLIPAELLSPSLVRKKCVVHSCNNERFARGYCATHLMDSAVAQTPTTKIRKQYNLWGHHHEKADSVVHSSWKFVDRDEQHFIEIIEDGYTGERQVRVNNKIVYHGFPDLGLWCCEITIGHSVKTATVCRLDVNPTMKGYDYDLYIDGVRFAEAHANFLSKLSGAALLERFGADSTKPKEEEARHREYINRNWKATEEKDATRYGHTKSRLTWQFTVNGRRHVLVLEHGHTGGKKKIWLDNEVIFEKKPGLLAAKHKDFRFDFILVQTAGGLMDKDGKKSEQKLSVPCSVVISKNRDHPTHGGSDKTSSRPYFYDILIDNVPFVDCMKTTTDHLGGDILLKSTPSAPPSAPNGPTPTSPANAPMKGSANGDEFVAPAAVGIQSIASPKVTGQRRSSMFGGMSAEEIDELNSLNPLREDDQAYLDEPELEEDNGPSDQ